MRVSVVIPTYNSAPLVAEAVESVLAQTRPAEEVIVVDDGSTDDTEDRLASYAGRIHYFRQENARVAAARNRGVEQSTGDVIAFLDADDAWHPEKLQRQLSVLSQLPEIGLLATQLTSWPGEFSDCTGAPEARAVELSLKSLLLTNPLATSSIVVRREVLAQAGPFDTELFGPEDYDLWLRCARIAKVGMLQEPLTGYRDTLGSLGKQAQSMRRGLLRIHDKLDEAGIWESRWFRRKCRAHVDYTTGFMYLSSGEAGEAARLLSRSLATYPLPMFPPDVRYYFARVRLLLRAVLAARRQRFQEKEAGESTNGPSTRCRVLGNESS